MNRLLLFDIDGTLLDARGAGRSALRVALLDTYGEAGGIDDYPFQGRTDPAIVRALLRCAGLDDPSIERGLDRLWIRYCQCLAVELARRRGRMIVHPGVTELLPCLTEDPGFTCGLVTGNVEPGAWLKLEACGLDGEFAFGAFGSDSEYRERLPPLAIRRGRAETGERFRRRDVIVIGDTPDDIRCARASGVRVVAVATGAYSLDQLAWHGPDVLLPDLAERDRVLESVRA